MINEIKVFVLFALASFEFLKNRFENKSENLLNKETVRNMT